MEPHLPDIIDYGLKVIFIGFNPGMTSARTGHHYAGASNRFWKLLFESGLTPHRIGPEEDRTLLDMGYGSTNIVARPTKSAAEIRPEEFRQGAIALKRLLREYKPQIACYVGIGVYRVLTGKEAIKCGAQEQYAVEGVTDYVCSSPSGLNRIPYDEQLQCFKGLRNLLAPGNK